ncbi:hypothetical protein QUB05_07435 [Microcoleus sp. F10-C6]|uniref:hypothetical protein n=1 Tax=unclassified Microcoleus TaxID=2642155 RepID=UPI002FD69FD9
MLENSSHLYPRFIKPFSFIAKPEETLLIDESQGRKEPKSFNANLNATPQPFDFCQFKPLKSSIAPSSKQSQTREFEAKLKTEGINLHSD